MAHDIDSNDEDTTALSSRLKNMKSNANSNNEDQGSSKKRILNNGVLTDYFLTSEKTNCDTNKTHGQDAHKFSKRLRSDKAGNSDVAPVQMSDFPVYSPIKSTIIEVSHKKMTLILKEIRENRDAPIDNKLTLEQNSNVFVR